MFTQDLINFMMDIRFNNNKQFMAEHKDEYISKMRTPYYELIEHMAPAMLAIDPNMEVRPAKCLSRIFRDTRFTRDKSPYRDHHWVAFRRAGIPKDQAPMFWFEIRVEQVTWGLGFWGENKTAMGLLRKRMLAMPDDFIAINGILNENDFELLGDQYKRLNVPEDLRPELETWYARKEVYVRKRSVDPQVIFDREFADMLIHDFSQLAPLFRMMQGTYDLSLNGGDQSGL